MKYILKFWKVESDGSKVLVCEDSWRSDESTAEDIAEQAGSIIQEAVESNG